MTTKQKNPISLKNCTLSIYKDTIVLMKINDNAEIEKECAINIVKEILILTHNKPFCLLVDTSNIFGDINKEAKAYFSSEPAYNKLKIATAVIVNNLPARLILNFYQQTYLTKQKKFKIVKNFEEGIRYFSV